MSVKILVVDDEPDLQALIKQKFRKKIRNNEYEFAFAEDGVDALDKINLETDFDMILSDINMPRMDGLTLLNKVKEANPLLKTVIVSAYSDLGNIRTAMNNGAYDFVTKPVDFNDLNITLEKTINHTKQLKETLNAVRENNLLKMYVDDSLLHFMDSKDFEQHLEKNELIVAAVMFVDLCGFTAFSEKETPNNVVNLLNQYFDEIVNTIIKHDGYIDKFIGDAVMAVFKGEHHAEEAVEAALAVRQKIDELKKDADLSKFNGSVSIGICDGQVLVGNIGSKSLKRFDYTVIGDIVNTAARLESIAKQDQIVILEKTYQKIKESFRCEHIDTFKLKNKENIVNVYNVIE